MLLSYDDFFRAHFEARGIPEREGRIQLEVLEIILDAFIVAELEDNGLGTDDDLGSDEPLLPVESEHNPKLDFNSAALDTPAGKKET